MHMTRTVAVAGASGYAGGELLRLLLAHPEVEIGALTGGQQRRAGRSASLQPHLVPLADRVLEPTDAEPSPATTSSSSPCRTASPARSRPRSARRRRRHRLRRRLPARRRRRSGSSSTAASTPAPGPTACPSCPASARRLRGARRIAVPGCYPTVSTLTLAPAIAAGLVDARRRRGRRLRHQRRRQGRQAAPARQRGHGQRQRLRRRRHPPPHARDHPEPLGPRRRSTVSVSFTPLLVPMSRGILATCSAPLAAASAPTRPAPPTPRPTPTSRSCTCCPRASGPRPSPCPAPTPSTSRSPSTRPPGRLVAVGAVDSNT